MEVEMVIAVPPLLTELSPIGASDVTLVGLYKAVSHHSDPVTTARRAVASWHRCRYAGMDRVGDQTLIQVLLERIIITLPCDHPAFLMLVGPRWQKPK
jgi:hypothetical protein